MKYFVTDAEDLHLDHQTRPNLRGQFALLSKGYTHYELTGPAGGDLAVLVPGLTIPLFYWDKVVPHLHENGIRTLAFSAYGRGFSDRAVGTYDEPMFVRQLTDLLDYLEVDTPVDLVGTSMGALGALAFTVERRAAVRSLALIGPAGLSTDTALQQKVLKLDPVANLAARRFGRRILLGHLGHNVADPALVDPLRRMISDCYRVEGSMYSFFSTLQHYPLSGRDQLFAHTGRLGVPTLLAWGTEDQVTPITGLDAARALLKPDVVEVIDHCGHMAPYEQPHRTADIMSTFFHTQHDRTTS